MRRLPAALLAAALLALALPAVLLAQAVDPGTPTTITPDPDTPTGSDGSTGPAPAPGATTPDAVPGATGTAPAAPPATTTTPVPTETVPTAAVPPPAPAQPPPAAPAPAAETAAADEGGDSRLALAVLIVLGALVLLLALIWAVARWQGVEPPWWPRVRHSLAEFGWRASGAWADFTDWVRLGR